MSSFRHQPKAGEYYLVDIEWSQRYPYGCNMFDGNEYIRVLSIEYDGAYCGVKASNLRYHYLKLPIDSLTLTNKWQPNFFQRCLGYI